MGLEALAGIGWVDVTALGSIVGHQPLQRHVTAASVAGEHACETAACTGWWPMNMHGLAKDAVVLSLDRAGTQARQSMLHASLAPPSGKAEGSADKRIIMLR